MTVLRILPPLVSVEITVWRLGGFTSILEQSTLSNERTPSPNVHTLESPSKSSDGPLSADRSLTPTDSHLNMQMMLTVMTYKLPRVHDQYLQNKASFLFVDCPSASAPSTDHDVLLSLTPILFHLVVQSFSVLESSTTAQRSPFTSCMIIHVNPTRGLRRAFLFFSLSSRLPAYPGCYYLQLMPSF